MEQQEQSYVCLVHKHDDDNYEIQCPNIFKTNLLLSRHLDQQSSKLNPPVHLSLTERIFLSLILNFHQFADHWFEGLLPKEYRNK